MKMITALIKPERLPYVKEELYKVDVTKMTVTTALGCGQQMGYDETFRGSKTEINLLKKVRLDVAINEDFVDKTVKAIIKGAKSNENGKIGDGKIFVTTLDECIRIRSEERGKVAIG